MSSKEVVSLVLRCKKLDETPSVVTDWEQQIWCPDCEHYSLGACLSPSRTSNSSPCPFDGKALPLRVLAGGLGNDRPQDAMVGVRSQQAERPRPSAELELAIKHEIGQRTGGRIHALEVEVIDDRVVVRGCAANYYLKQLAIQAVLDVLGSAGAPRIELNIQVVGSLPNPRE
jgi:hypothetical protein